MVYRRMNARPHCWTSKISPWSPMTDLATRSDLDALTALDSDYIHSMPRQLRSLPPTRDGGGQNWMCCSFRRSERYAA